MNLICNNCASGFVYSKTKTQYNNPFMWNLISADDFIKLILHWKTINFYSITFPLEMPTNSVNITIDNDILVKYIHIKFDATAKKPIKKFVDVYTSTPWEYAFNKYLNRLQRMHKENESPTFLISDDTTTPTVDTVRPDNSIILLNQLNDAKIQSPLIWATPHNIDAKEFCNLNLTIIHPDNQYVGTVADYIIDNHIIKIK